MTAGHRVSDEPGYVLHTLAFGETSLLVEALTPGYGRVGMIAKGARAAKSRLRGVLQLGQPLMLSWRDSGELATLGTAEISAQPVALMGEALFCAWYLNELMLRLLRRRHPHPKLFLAYTAALPQLATSASVTLRLFEALLIEELGEPLQLPASLEAEGQYVYDWDAGPLPSQGEGRAWLPGCSGAGLIALRDHDVTQVSRLNECRPLLRAAIARLMGNGKLHTPGLLRQLMAVE